MDTEERTGAVCSFLHRTEYGPGEAVRYTEGVGNIGSPERSTVHVNSVPLVAAMAIGRPEQKTMKGLVLSMRDTWWGAGGAQ